MQYRVCIHFVGVCEKLMVLFIVSINTTFRIGAT